jgi:hypothetical protein
LKKARRCIVPSLMGIIILIEGIAMAAFARGVEFIDVITLDKMLVLVLGVALAVLGLLLVLPVLPFWKDDARDGILKKVQIGAAAAALLLSLAFLFIVSEANVDGVGEVSKMTMAIIPIQMFFLSILALVFINYEPLESRGLSRIEWLGHFSACAVMVLGAAVFGLRGELNVHGELQISAVVMGVTGIVIMVLGLVEVIIFSRRREGVSESIIMITDWASIPVSIMISVIGLMVLVVTTSITLDGTTYGYIWMLLLGLLLALLGAVLNYANGLVAQREGWHMDIILVTTIAILVMTPLAAML